MWKFDLESALDRHFERDTQKGEEKKEKKRVGVRNPKQINKNAFKV